MSSGDRTIGTGSFSRAERLLSKSSDLIRDMGWKGLGQSIIGSSALVVFLGLGDLFNSILNVPIAIFNTLASVIPALNEATFGGIAGFVGAAFDAGAGSFGTGWTALLGVFQTPFGIGVALISLWEIAWYLDYVDRDVIGFAIDIPDMILNNDDSGVADEDE